MKKKTKLSSVYTKEVAQSIKHLMPDDVADELAKLLQEAVDKEILNEIKGADLESKGWTKIPVPIWDLTLQAWLDENMIDKYFATDYNIYFKRQQDATLFALRWSE